MIVSPDKSLKVDPVVFDIIKHIKSEIPLVPITRLENFQFNTDLLNLDRYIILNFCEFDWNFEWDTTPVFGKNVHSFREKFIGDEWSRLIEFVDNRSPILTFQRELLKKDVRENILPIEFPAFNEIPEIESKEKFNSRPLELFYNWGLSNPMRPKLQGDIWHGMSKYGYALCDNLSHPTFDNFLNYEKGRRWLSVNSQWHSRYKIADILKINGMSKLSVSLFGSGRKCFRNTEASVNSLMVMPEDNFAWTYEWVDGYNCIKFKSDDYVEELNRYSQEDHYISYVYGVNTCKKYYLPNYISHLEKIIRECV